VALVRLLPLLQMGRDLPLPAPGAQGRTHRIREHCRMERPLQQSHVAEEIGEAFVRRGAAMVEQDEGEVRPGRLALGPVGDGPAIGAQERLLGDHRAGRRIEVRHEVGEAVLDARGDADLGQDCASNPGVAPAGCQDQRDGIGLRHGFGVR
jgi:hypothetical protein